VVPQLKLSSVRYYGLQIRCHLLPTFGTWRIKDITKAEVAKVPCEQGESRDSQGSSVHACAQHSGKCSKLLWTGTTGAKLCSRHSLGDRAPSKERAYLLPEQLSPLLNSLPELCRRLVVITVLTGLRIG